MDPNKSKNPEAIQTIISNAFRRANHEIHQLNDAHNIKTPNLKMYVEAKTTKGKRKEYKGRQQKKICQSKFEADLIHIKDETRKKMVDHMLNYNAQLLKDFQ